jgi:hypothetical protein
LFAFAQAAAAFEAGLESDPFNSTLKAGLQCAQQGLVQDLLDGKTLSRKALPAPPTPGRITLAPHNKPTAALLRDTAAAAAASSAQQQLLLPGQQYAVGWQKPSTALLTAAASGQLAAAAANDGDFDGDYQQQLGIPGDAQLPRVLLTPAAAAADPALRDVFEYVSTQVGSRAHQSRARSGVSSVVTKTGLSDVLGYVSTRVVCSGSHAGCCSDLACRQCATVLLDCGGH